MSKSRRKRPRKPKKPESLPLPESLDPLELSRRVVATGLAALQSCMERITTMLDDDGPPCDVCGRKGQKYDDRLASHFAYLLKHAAGVMEANRKLDAHYHRWAQQAAPEDRDAIVVQYLRDLPPARRAAMLNMLDAEEEQALLS